MKKITETIACLGFVFLTSCGSSSNATPYLPPAVSTLPEPPAQSVESETSSQESIPVVSSESSSQKTSSSVSSSKPSKQEYLSAQIKKLGGGGGALVATLENGKGTITIDPSFMVRFTYRDGDYRDQLTCQVTWGLESFQANGQMTYSGVNGSQYFSYVCTLIMVVNYSIGATSYSVTPYGNYTGNKDYSSDILQTTRTVVNVTVSFVNDILSSY